MLQAKAKEILKGYWQVIIVDGNEERVAIYSKGWKTCKGAEKWIVKQGYELVK